MTKAAVVLGGSAGVGLAVVEDLIGRGYRVGIVARGTERLRELTDRFGSSIETEAADVADSAALEDATDRLVERLGPPTIWVNSAMVTSFSPFEKVAPEEFERIVQVTFLGQVNGTRAALRHMSRGHIVCVGSGLAYRSVPNQAAYCASKHAINGFAASLRSELLKSDSKVTLHLVQLPAINTPQFDWALNRMDEKPQPAPPIYAPEVAAAAVMRAIDTGAREILVGKSVLQLVFGQFVLPDYLDRRMAREGVESQKSGRADDSAGLGNLYDPVAHEATAEGSYSKRASSDGVIVDGDKARIVVFGATAAAIFVFGILLGLLLG